MVRSRHWSPTASRPQLLAGTLAALAGAGGSAFALPEEPLLTQPTVADLLVPVSGHVLSGDPALLTREVTGLVVAGMTMPNVLDRLFEGAAVVTAADRPEVVLGVLMAHASLNFPQISRSSSTVASRCLPRSSG